MRNKLILAVVVGAILFAAAGILIFSQQKADDSPYAEPANPAPPTTQKSNVTPGSTLDLSGKSLTELPASTRNQPETTILNISNNQLTTLPDWIDEFTLLENLNAENNRLETLPPSIGELKKLKTADFGNNRLQSLPAELGNLTQLESLNLSGYKGPPSDIEQLKAKLPNTEIKT